jgi:hypothetical protein
MFRFTSILVVTACWFSLAVLPLHAGNIVGNPSFEAGASCSGFSGAHCLGQAPWIFSPGSDPAFGVSSNPGFAAPGGGAKAAYFGGSTYDTIYQVLTTTPGQLYNLTFWLNTSLDHSQSDFRVFWDSVMIYDDPAGTDLAHQFPYKEITVSPLLGTGSDTLAFQGYNPPRQDAFDLVSVEAVPEPASWMLMCIGGLGLALFRRALSNCRG